MMLRYAAVRADGTIARIVSASDEEAVTANWPESTTKIVAPADVVFGLFVWDAETTAFQPISLPSEASQ